MRLIRRHPGDRWALLLAAAVTLLPPGAWSLCLDRAGDHFALEPTAVECAAAGRTGSGPEDACGTASHDACEDYVLLNGQLTTARTPTVLEFAPLATATPADEVPRESALVSRPIDDALRTHRPPPSAPTVLRC